MNFKEKHLFINLERIKVLLRYDLDNNGYLNQHDFDCLAVKFTLLEGRGQWNKARYRKNEARVISDLNILKERFSTFERHVKYVIQ